MWKVANFRDKTYRSIVGFCSSLIGSIFIGTIPDRDISILLETGFSKVFGIFSLGCFISCLFILYRIIRNRKSYQILALCAYSFAGISFGMLFLITKESFPIYRLWFVMFFAISASFWLIYFYLTTSSS